MTRETEQKHTPGPWDVADNRSLNEAWWITVDHPEVGTVSIAEVRDGCDEAAELGLEEANARLIAAAPEMLEALMTMISEEDDYGNGEVFHPATLSAARAAIRKATGASND